LGAYDRRSAPTFARVNGDGPSIAILGLIGDRQMERNIIVDQRKRSGFFVAKGTVVR